MILDMKVRGPILKHLRIQSEGFGYYPNIYRGQEDIAFERILDKLYP